MYNGEQNHDLEDFRIISINIYIVEKWNKVFVGLNNVLFPKLNLWKSKTNIIFAGLKQICQ